MLKVLLVLITTAFVMTSGIASAGELWVANGVRQVAVQNNASVQVLPFHADGFASEANCTDFITDQNALALSKNVKGYAMFNHVDATCSLAKPSAQ